VKLFAAERLLVVTGERKRPPAPGRVYQQMEIEYGAFERQVRLGEDVDPERATARFDRGFLTVELPVIEKPMPTGRYRITVERLD
jgi:HSP20 family protein